MSDGVTPGALERLSRMPDGDDNYGLIAAQKYFDIYFTGGTISGVTIDNLDTPLPIADGGTGQSTANAALNALLPSQTGNAGKALKTDGTNTSWSTDTDTGITQLTGDVTAGPGSGSQAATLATVNGNVGSFTNASITVNGKGLITAASSGTAPVTSVSGTANRITSTGGATPIIDISAAYVGQNTITTLGTITTGTWNGTTVAVANGGTGQTTYTNGQLLIGNTTGNTLTKGTLTQPAAGLTIANGTGTITFALADDLAALEAMGGTGIVTRTASNTYAQRTITGTTNEISVSNGDGVSGNPTISLDDPAGSGNLAITFTTPGNLAVTYTNNTYNYYRIGNMVIVDVNIVTATFTHTTASGNLMITGFPFTISNTNAPYGSLVWGGITKANYTNMVLGGSSNSTIVNVFASGSGQMATNVTASDTPSGGTILLRGTIIYRI